MLSSTSPISLLIFLILPICSSAIATSSKSLGFPSSSHTLSHRSPDPDLTDFKCAPYDIYQVKRIQGIIGYRGVYTGKTIVHRREQPVTINVIDSDSDYKHLLQQNNKAKKWFKGQPGITQVLVTCEIETQRGTYGVIITAHEDPRNANMWDLQTDYLGVYLPGKPRFPHGKPDFLYWAFKTAYVKDKDGSEKSSNYFESDEQLLLSHHRQLIAAMVRLHNVDIHVDDEESSAGAGESKTKRQEIVNVHAAHRDIQPGSIYFDPLDGQQSNGQLLIDQFKFLTTETTAVFHKGKKRDGTYIMQIGSEEAWSPEARSGKPTDVQKNDVWAVCYTLLKTLLNPFTRHEARKVWQMLYALSELSDEERALEFWRVYDSIHTLTVPAARFFAKCFVAEALRPDMATLEGLFEDAVKEEKSMLRRSGPWFNPIISNQ